MKQFFQILVVLLISLSSCQGKQSRQEVRKEIQLSDSTDQEIFNSIWEIAGSMSIDSLPLNDRVVEVAKMFMQTDYVGGTLDGNEKEQMVVNFRELDCTTYLENVVALSKVLSNDSLTTDDFLKELENLRYRNGKLTDYASRLHYFSDWIYENEKKGIVKNITCEIGGEKYNKTINFMSTHVDSYPALKVDVSLVEEIRKTENEINKRELFFIPENNIQNLENKIQNGDLIAITTKIEGLDISHVGIAIHVNNRLHLMHASSKAKKVVISDIPLAEMLMQSKYQSGIIVARLK
ncbi:N-acetylmuramoyl-L-alanine amidase-like domain-containing protein [Labilibaculum manganireducens]|uniref:N-acetylmuramoyl-L-alanine amidase-like domain-containing protein n=1 Tax=Labilibaculum manganireducens TaxID=1940525 RepID=UPI0029F4B22B|nr:N-acetylmuramoyl-L-alanine amidase-like domain-containing protein [Labilibaculum manganireducens]